MEILYFIQMVGLLLAAVVPHEYAHGWMALRCGDPTAKLCGRLTLNPIKHIDPFGTIFLPALLAFLHIVPIGWAKPVPVDFTRLRNPRRDMVWVALAGPAVNIFMALGLAVILRLIGASPLAMLLMAAIFINLLLAFFNLIPIPPLDGSRIAMGLLPLPLARRLSRVEPYGFIIIVVLLQFKMLDWVWGIAETVAIRLAPNLQLFLG